jgi:hypothetical protein
MNFVSSFNRQRHRESGSPALLAFYLDTAIAQLDYALDKRQAESVALTCMRAFSLPNFPNACSSVVFDIPTP